MKHEGKVVIVTGAAQGLGLACAERFLDEGAKVFLVDILKEKLETAVQRLGSNTAAYVSDLSLISSSKAKELVDAAVRRFGRIDILVSNAGIIHLADFVDFPEDMFDLTQKINVKSAFLIGQAVARQMIKQGDGGAIVNMSSVNANLAIPNAVAYAVSKGAMKQLTAVMAVSLTPHNIRVNAVGPGTILTELVSGSIMASDVARRNILARTPIGRCGEPAEVASVVSFLASDDASYIVGQTIYPDGGRSIVNYMVPVQD
jgi:NAD(P)-dependent dehydrogenase (short-subunit alcohol dehydrogenase family)